jgi:universal stress protein E
MKSIERILVVADPTKGSDVQAQRAVKRAFALAERTKAELQIFVVCDYNEYVKGARSLDPAGLAEARRNYSTRKHAWLQEVVSALATPSVRVRMEMAWDRPRHEGITRQVLRYKPDLVIKDTHHHPAIARALFTNTDWHLIRECPAPLMLVRTESWPSTGKVLAAVDPLHERDKTAALDRKIVDTAAHVAETIGGELHVLHVFEPMEAMITAGDEYLPYAIPLDEVGQKRRSQYWKALQSLVTDLHLPAKRLHLRSGFVRDQLCDMARELDAGLIVMGAIARSGLKRVFLGSTAEDVLEWLPCDVLIVKPDGFECPVELYEQADAFSDVAARA